MIFLTSFTGVFCTHRNFLREFLFRQNPCSTKFTQYMLASRAMYEPVHLCLDVFCVLVVFVHKCNMSRFMFGRMCIYLLLNAKSYPSLSLKTLAKQILTFVRCHPGSFKCCKSVVYKLEINKHLINLTKITF